MSLSVAENFRALHMDAPREAPGSEHPGPIAAEDFLDTWFLHRSVGSSPVLLRFRDYYRSAMAQESSTRVEKLSNLILLQEAHFLGGEQTEVNRRAALTALASSLQTWDFLAEPSGQIQAARRTPASRESTTDAHRVLGRLLSGRGRTNLLQNLETEVRQLGTDDLNYTKRVRAICDSLRLVELSETPDSPRRGVILDLRKRLLSLPSLPATNRTEEFERVLRILASVLEAEKVARQLNLKPVKLVEKRRTVGGKKVFQVKSSG